MSERWPSQPTKVDEPEDGKVEDVVLEEEPPAEEVDAAQHRQLSAPERSSSTRTANLELGGESVNLIEGEPHGTRRGVAIVAARFNGEIVNKLLASALEELDKSKHERSRR